MEAITTGITTALGYVGTVLDAITSNTILTVLFAGGTFIPLAVRMFKKIKRAAR